jgi:hypothetical protein
MQPTLLLVNKCRWHFWEVSRPKTYMAGVENPSKTLASMLGGEVKLRGMPSHSNSMIVFVDIHWAWLGYAKFCHVN